jgi:hypothetical protein
MQMSLFFLIVIKDKKKTISQIKNNKKCYNKKVIIKNNKDKEAQNNFIFQDYKNAKK